MLRCSGSSRDFSAESCEEYVYKNLREESPPSEAATSALNPNNKFRLNLCHGNINYQQQQQQQLQHDNRNENFAYHNIHVGDMANCCINCENKRHSLGNGAINGVATISPSWQRKDSAASLQSGDSIDGVIKPKSTKSNRRKNSIGCLNSLSSSPKSPNGYYTIRFYL